MLILPWLAHPCSLGYHIPAVLLLYCFLGSLQARVHCDCAGILSAEQNKPDCCTLNLLWSPYKAQLHCLLPVTLSKHAGSNSEAFWFRPLWPACCQNWAGSDFSRWSVQVLDSWIWPRSKSACKNHQARFWQSATSPLPVSQFQTRLHSSTDGLDQESLGLLVATASEPICIRCESDPACLLGQILNSTTQKISGLESRVVLGPPPPPPPPPNYAEKGFIKKQSF